MEKLYTEYEERFCKLVSYTCTRPGMYTYTPTVENIVHFLAGAHHSLFPSLGSESPMIRYRDRVLDPEGSAANLAWERILMDSFGDVKNSEEWFNSFKDSFQDFCKDTYGENFAIQAIQR